MEFEILLKLIHGLCFSVHHHHIIYISPSFIIIIINRKLHQKLLELFVQFLQHYFIHYYLVVNHY
jgi:hypothetical protein